MAVSRVSLSSITQGFPKSRSFLDGNSAYIPSSFESIATINPTSGAGSITFSSIPQTYKSLQIRCIARDTFNGTVADGQNISSGFYNSMSFNGATVSTAAHQLLGTGSSANAYAKQPTSYMVFGGLFVSAGAPTGTFAAGIIDIIDYASTTKNKTVRIFTGANANTSDTAYGVSLGSTFYNSTTAVTSISILAPSAFAAGSTFALYGIK